MPDEHFEGKDYFEEMRKMNGKVKDLDENIVGPSRDKTRTLYLKKSEIEDSLVKHDAKPTSDTNAIIRGYQIISIQKEL